MKRDLATALAELRPMDFQFFVAGGGFSLNFGNPEENTPVAFRNSPTLTAVIP
jgi:hypothetical protein